MTKTECAGLFAIILLPVGLVVGSGATMQRATREVLIPPGTVIQNNHHPTDRSITVVQGSAEYRDAQGTRQLRAGDHLFIPAEARHSLTVGGDGITLHSEGFAPQGEVLHSCAGGM